MILAMALVGISMFLSLKLSNPRSNFHKRLPYECGEQTIGPSWIKFNPGFYIFGLIFLLFDIESIFLIPWTLISREIGYFGLIEVLLFVLVLSIGLIYAWIKGALEWKI